jgi:asparagine synthase (glutamine-hydrolysing)
MCGIAGFFLRDKPAELADVERMCAAIRHRGPDDDGFHLDGGCAIGMRRLSIIDLHSGHQPISNEDQSAWIVFNGEIYNYPDLRRDLLARGHRLATKSDTETIVHLYEDEGPAAVARLRGMFAIALWDARRRRLLLARDRFGKKPLYYAVLPHGIYFASELKCFRGLDIPFDIDTDALKFYFQFGYIPDPWTPFRAIRKLAPGGWLTYDSDGAVVQDRYWTLPAPATEPAPGMTEAGMRDRLREVFDESVRIRMIADVPLGAFLSGGIDSSSIVASMALQSKEPVKTFSIGFEEAEFNELPYARELANQYKTDHHELIVRPDSVGLISRLAHHFDEPFADSAAIPTFLVSEFAARYVKVVLTGDGGDELFAGYESFFDIQKLSSFDRIPQAARRMLSSVADLLPYSTYGKNRLRVMSRPSALDRYFEHIYTPFMLRRELLNPEWMLAADAGFLARSFPDCLLADGTETLSQALYFEATAKLTGDMLVKVDRMSMAHSLEVRCPLLDHELAELSASIPTSWKMRNGQGKAILIDAIGDRLPPALRHRKKMGFGVPLAHWFRGPLREFLHDHLLGDRFTGRGIASPAFVRHLIQEHQSGRRDNSDTLWALLMLELWFRNWEPVAPETSAQPVLADC